MSELCRELTSKELVERNNCEDKELILSRMKAEDDRTTLRMNTLEEELNDNIILVNAYRKVLKDLIRRG